MSLTFEAMHYTGMASAHYMVIKDGDSISTSQISSSDLSLVVVIAASATCFLMLVVSSIVSGKRTDMAHLNLLLNDERKKNNNLLINLSANVQKLNDLVGRIAMEEFQTRRVMDVVNDAVCIIDSDGLII